MSMNNNDEREALAELDAFLDEHFTPSGRDLLMTILAAAGFHRSEVPEPSADYEAGYAEGFHHGLSSPRGAAEGDREPEPQGEPSDASVRAALSEWFQGIIAGGWTAEHEARMRAALRAASAVPAHEVKNR